MKNELTLLANRYLTDKGDEYMCAHNYTQHYHNIFNTLKDKPLNILEIGLNRSNTLSIPSLEMYKTYFSNATLYGFDIMPEFMAFNDPDSRINIVIGDQSNPQDLQLLNQHSFDIIIDDGYHASMHQQISFKNLWSCVVPGGIYIVEDLHYQPDSTIETSTKTKAVLQSWNTNNPIFSDWISKEDFDTIFNSIEKIEFYSSDSAIWPKQDTANALAVIYKTK